MQVVLLRIGIDSGYGGIQGPLFKDGSFEFIPIPDQFGGKGVDSRTYGNTVGGHGRPLIEYFPDRLRERMRDQPMHVDPDFVTFTYGDPTPPKRSLRQLQEGDLLVFYAGLEGWHVERKFTEETSSYIYKLNCVSYAQYHCELGPEQLPPNPSQVQ